MIARQLFSSASVEWLTPEWLIAEVVRFFGVIDLDPACNPGAPHVPATRYYREADDGLVQPWHSAPAHAYLSDRVFCNPPYGRQIGRWVAKAVREWEQHAVQTILLLPARTDTRYWQGLLTPYPVVFFAGRLQFCSTTGSTASAPFPSAVVWLGHEGRAPAFCAQFGAFGAAYLPVDRGTSSFVLVR